MKHNLDPIALQLVQWLRLHHKRIVFAESCTAGLVAATLAKIPGVSDCLCGSAVTYTDETKVDWLGVSVETIEQFTAVSDQVARQMAAGVLATTKLADVAAAITGHLGPGAPPSLDGVVFVSLAERVETTSKIESLRITVETNDRVARQIEAAERLLEFVVQKLSTQK